MGQRRGEAECLADARGGLVGLSLRASRDVSAVGCLGLTLSACLCLASHNRGFGGQLLGMRSQALRETATASRVERWKRACDREIARSCNHRDGGALRSCKWSVVHRPRQRAAGRGRTGAEDGS